MNKTLPLNVINCLDKIYGRMKDNYNFAYPNDSFDVTRAHQILCRFSVFSENITSIFSKENFLPSNELENIFAQQMLGNAKVINFDKEWAYPNGNLAENRTPSALNCIETSMKNYHNSIKLLGNHCFKNNNVNFDVIHFISNISCAQSYNYAYPNNYYNEDKAHAALQMLLTLTENIIFVVDSIVCSNKELQKIILNYSEKLSDARTTLNNAYSNKSFNKQLGHQCLSKFIDQWKNAKEVCVPLLKTYFETQAIIADYETKLSQQAITVENSHDESVIKKDIIVDIPVVKKIKSLL